VRWGQGYEPDLWKGCGQWNRTTDSNYQAKLEEYLNINNEHNAKMVTIMESFASLL